MTDTTTNDARHVLWERVNGGIAAGLPVPLSLNIRSDSFGLRCDNNEAEAVERWARHLGFPVPNFHPKVYAAEGSRPAWRTYKSDNGGWLGTVLADIWCAVDEIRSDSDAILAEAGR